MKSSLFGTKNSVCNHKHNPDELKIYVLFSNTHVQSSRLVKAIVKKVGATSEFVRAIKADASEALQGREACRLVYSRYLHRGQSFRMGE